MTSDPSTLPAEAYAPDADRVGPDASRHLPEWVVHLIASIACFMLERMFATRRGRARLPAWWHYRPDLPPGSVQQLAASIRGEFGNAIVWMCRRRGIGPGHPDWPELSRAIIAFGGSTKGFRPGLPACGLQWWENPHAVPGMLGEIPANQAAAAMAELLARQAADEGRAIPAGMAPAGMAPAEPADARLAATTPPPAFPRRALARSTTGPPIGPPVGDACLGDACQCPDIRTNGAGARPAPPY